MIFHRCHFFSISEIFFEIFFRKTFFFEMTSWRFHTIPDRSQPLHIAKSDYQDSEILGFWSEIDDMVLALLRATMTSGGCARQFWHGQGCPEVIRYRELEKSWRLSERKPREWCDFRVGREYSYSSIRDSSIFEIMLFIGRVQDSCPPKETGLRPGQRTDIPSNEDALKNAHGTRIP